MKDVLTKEHLFGHPISKVWSAITNGNEISAWFIEADFKPQKGYQYTFTATKESGCTQITGEVKKVDPYTLEYTWIVSPTTVETTVTWVLKEVEGGTKLFLKHTGISNFSGETAVEMFNSFNGGWDNCINLLSTYLKDVVHAG